MTQQLRSGGDKGAGRIGLVRFSRAEFNRLISLYSQRVAKGEWRDYAIALRPGQAVFAVYRHAFERPLYTITKREDKRDQAGFEITSGARQLCRADTLEEALSVLEPKLRLVH